MFITLDSKYGLVRVERSGYGNFNRGILLTTVGHSVNVPLPRHVTVTGRKGGLLIRMDTGLVYKDRPRVTFGATVYDVNGLYYTFQCILRKLKESGCEWLHNHSHQDADYFLHDLKTMTGI